MDYDLKIINGLVIDGTGAPGRVGDVAIKDGRIVALGDAPGTAAQEIDARDRVTRLSRLRRHPHSLRRAGLVGPAAVHLAVAWRDDRRDGQLRLRHRACAQGTPQAADPDVGEGRRHEAPRRSRSGLGTEWGFETFPQYLDLVERRGTAINVAALLGHTPVRLYVMGESATERCRDRRRRLPRCVASSRKPLTGNGALGLATSKLPAHLGFGGRPVPSRAADFSEVRALAAAIPEAGHGMIQTTLLGPGLLLEQLEQLARETGASISWSALLAGSAFGKSGHKAQLAKSEELFTKGLKIAPQVTPRPLNFEFQFREPTILEGMTFFKPVAAADFAGKTALYRDPAFRAQFRERWDTAWPELKQAFGMIAIAQFAPEPQLEERLVADVARARGVHPVDLMLDMSLATELEASFRMPLANHRHEGPGRRTAAQSRHGAWPVGCRRACEPAVRRMPGDALARPLGPREEGALARKNPCRC